MWGLAYKAKGNLKLLLWWIGNNYSSVFGIYELIAMCWKAIFRSVEQAQTEQMGIIRVV